MTETLIKLGAGAAVVVAAGALVSTAAPVLVIGALVGGVVIGAAVSSPR